MPGGDSDLPAEGIPRRTNRHTSHIQWQTSAETYQLGGCPASHRDCVTQRAIFALLVYGAITLRFGDLASPARGRSALPSPHVGKW